MNHFKKSLQEQARANQILEDLCQAAVALGISEQGLNAPNAALFCFKALEEYRNLKQLAAELGTTLPRVLQSYQMRNRGDELIPAELRYAPPHWVREAGIQKTEYYANGQRKCKVYKQRAVSASTAQRLRVGLQPQLIALFTLIRESGWSEDEQRDYTGSLIESYQRESYEIFSSQVAKELWELSSDKGEEVAGYQSQSEGIHDAEIYGARSAINV